MTHDSWWHKHDESEYWRRQRDRIPNIPILLSIQTTAYKNRLASCLPKPASFQRSQHWFKTHAEPPLSSQHLESSSCRQHWDPAKLCWSNSRSSESPQTGILMLKWHQIVQHLLNCEILQSYICVYIKACSTCFMQSPHGVFFILFPHHGRIPPGEIPLLSCISTCEVLHNGCQVFW